MSTGYSRSPRLLKGALVEFSERFLGPIPNIIVFQYNPEKLSRALTVWQSPSGEAAVKTAPAQAQPNDPPETISLELMLDAADDLEKPERHPIAYVSGVADRLAALEMLLYPEQQSLLAGLLGSVSASLGGGAGAVAAAGAAAGAAIRAIAGIKAKPIPASKVPVVLFVWGPGRIVPVRLQTFKVEEQAYSPLLYPIRATVSITMTLLTETDFPDTDDNKRTLSESIAVGAYKFTRKQKQVLAAANLANSAESILGMLPI